MTALAVRVLARVAQGGATRHLEVETYTWEALPEHERRAGSGFDLVEALARELEWVGGALERHGAHRVGAPPPRSPAPPASVLPRTSEL